MPHVEVVAQQIAFARARLVRFIAMVRK